MLRWRMRRQRMRPRGDFCFDWSAFEGDDTESDFDEVIVETVDQMEEVVDYYTRTLYLTREFSATCAY